MLGWIKFVCALERRLMAGCEPSCSNGLRFDRDGSHDELDRDESIEDRMGFAEMMSLD